MGFHVCTKVHVINCALYFGETHHIDALQLLRVRMPAMNTCGALFSIKNKAVAVTNIELANLVPELLYLLHSFATPVVIC
jgi:hypothetical protein